MEREVGQGVAVPERVPARPESGDPVRGCSFSRRTCQRPAQPASVGLTRSPRRCPHSLCRPDPPAEQEAGGLAALCQRPAGARALVRGLLLHAQGPAGEAEGPRTSLPLGGPRPPGQPCPWGPVDFLSCLLPCSQNDPSFMSPLGWRMGTLGSQRVTAPQPVTPWVTAKVWTLLARVSYLNSSARAYASYEGGGVF